VLAHHLGQRFRPLFSNERSLPVRQRDQLFDLLIVIGNSAGQTQSQPHPAGLPVRTLQTFWRDQVLPAHVSSHGSGSSPSLAASWRWALILNRLSVCAGARGLVYHVAGQRQRPKQQTLHMDWDFISLFGCFGAAFHTYTLVLAGTAGRLQRLRIISLI